MRELAVRLSSAQPRPVRRIWRETFFFLCSFTASFIGALLMLDHAAAVLG